MSGGERSPDCVERAAALLAGGLTLRRAAKLAGVGEATLRRWRKRPAFRKRVAEVRERLLDRMLGRLSRGAVEGSAVLRRIARRGKKEGDRLRAAKAVIDLLLKAKGILELEERVRELEARLGGEGQS